MCTTSLILHVLKRISKVENGKVAQQKLPVRGGSDCREANSKKQAALAVIAVSAQTVSCRIKTTFSAAVSFQLFIKKGLSSIAVSEYRLARSLIFLS
jgi:hypothetical protein